MRSIKLTIAYDGADFHGWQIQPGVPTIQGTLNDAARKITQEKVVIHGASRTDTGVHALGQVAHFRTQAGLSALEFQRALNALIPPAIRIMSAEEVGPDFHSRWQAQGKTYRYRIYRGRVLPPFEYRRALHYPWPLDEDAMAAAAREFEGEHDFSSFAASSGSEDDDKDRNMTRVIFSSQIVREPGGEEMSYVVRGQSFLRYMVRKMVGTLIEVGKGRMTPGSIAEIFELHDRSRSGPTVPPEGLYLVSLEYPDPTDSLAGYRFTPPNGRNRVKLVPICGILLWMAIFPVRAAEDSISKIAGDARCASGLKWLERNSSWITDQHVHLTEIPAPEFDEGARGAALKDLLAASGFTVRTDKLGNVIGERPGSESKSVILVAAHLDTVFPAGTDVRVKRDGKRMMAPGISDNGSGLAALVAVARALFESRIQTTKTIVFSGDVGEEGEGNLRGIRALVTSYGARLSAVIAVDGPSSGHITTRGIASRRFEVSVSGPGGHSWSDFGEPNPITAIARGIVKFSATRVPDDPRSSYNFGVIEGGTSINSIPSRAAVKVDLRSEDDGELGRLESALRDAMQAGAKDELSAWQAPTDSLKLELRSLGVRPAGKLPDDSPLISAVRSVDEYLGNQSQLESSSTDANVPLSMGIPAIAIGSGGRGAGTHTLEEWFDPIGREMGLKRLYLTIVALAGLES